MNIISCVRIRGFKSTEQRCSSEADIISAGQDDCQSFINPRNVRHAHKYFPAGYCPKRAEGNLRPYVLLLKTNFRPDLYFPRT